MNSSLSDTPASANVRHYDMMIIGTGSGNSIPGPQFADRSIALIEKGRFGGTCLNVGCLPTKMFVLAADAARDAREAQRLGVHAHVDSVDWGLIQERVFGRRIDPIAAGGEAWRRGDENPNVDVFDGHASFIGPKTVTTTLDGEPVTVSADTVIIAAGARPSIPPVIADSKVTYHTNETIMRVDHLPKSMLIMGGGFIAAEFAHVFSALGTNVTVINRSGRLLRKEDEDVSKRFTEVASTQWNTILNTQVTSASEDANGVTLTLDDGSTVTGEVLLVATGRTPNGDQMNLSAAGIDMDGARIAVDEFGRTSAEGVWAVGDVSSPYQLKHVANAETRALVHNVTHPDDLRPMPHKAVPAAVFTHPQVASVGLTEKQARESGADVIVATQDYGDVGYGWALEDTTGFVKLIADRSTGHLLGAHIIGPQASTLIQQLITVMAFDMSLVDFARSQYWIHPALPEVVENALLKLEFDVN